MKNIALHSAEGITSNLPPPIFFQIKLVANVRKHYNEVNCKIFTIILHPEWLPQRRCMLGISIPYKMASVQNYTNLPLSGIGGLS